MVVPRKIHPFPRESRLSKLVLFYQCVFRRRRRTRTIIIIILGKGGLFVGGAPPLEDFHNGLCRVVLLKLEQLVCSSVADCQAPTSKVDSFKYFFCRNAKTKKRRIGRKSED